MPIRNLAEPSEDVSFAVNAQTHTGTFEKIRKRKQNNRQKNIKLHGFVNFDDCGDPSTPRNPPGTSGGFPGGSWGLPSRPALGPNTADAWNAIFETAGLHTTILWET